MKGRTQLLCMLGFALLAPAPALAQATKVAEDFKVGVRLTIPAGWEWEKRDSGTGGRMLFIKCGPKRPPVCILLVLSEPAAAKQAAITPADRTKLDAYVSADGANKILSRRDLTVAGFPAYEAVYQDAKHSNSSRNRRTFVLMPEAGIIADISLLATLNADHLDQVKPAVDTALQTLAPARKPGAKR